MQTYMDRTIYLMCMEPFCKSITSSVEYTTCGSTNIALIKIYFINAKTVIQMMIQISLTHVLLLEINIFDSKHYGYSASKPIMKYL